ncbi:MAG TPA: helix-turn-helix transcriptional regulator [Micromonosporaceae bacterium]|nr:helix-turn-helix transcriptional regulator [Micromonosporaceae bacterium]
MSPGPSPSVRRRRLGAELRRLREAAGLTGDQVIARVGWASASKLSRLENGRSRPDLADVLDLLDLYAVGGRERDELVAVARDAGNTRGWLRSYPVMTKRQRGYAELESGCADIREYATASVPGLLQTPDYARVRILSSRALQQLDAVDAAETAETEVAARVARQGILTRPADPTRYEAVIEETALSGRGGPPSVMRDQLAHLRRLAELPNITLRVLPGDATIGDRYLPHTPFSIYRFADPADPETVAVEALGNDLVLSEKPSVERYIVVFSWLREAALSPADSLAWLSARVVVPVDASD